MPLPDIVRALNDCQPAIFAAIHRCWHNWLKNKRTAGLAIRPTLHCFWRRMPDARSRRNLLQRFNAAFRIPMQHPNFMGIAFECTHGRLHVNSDWVILEPVDANYHPRATGQSVAHRSLNQSRQSCAAVYSLRNRRQRHFLSGCLSMWQSTADHRGSKGATTKF